MHDRSQDVGPTRMNSEADPLLKEVLSPIDSEEDWQGEQQSEETKSSWFLFLLTFGGLGLSIGWSVETSNGSVSLSPCASASHTRLSSTSPRRC